MNSDFEPDLAAATGPIQLTDYGALVDDNGNKGNDKMAPPPVTGDAEGEPGELPAGTRYLILAVICTVTFLGKAERTMIAPFYPIYAIKMNVTEFGVGMVVGSFDFTIWLSSLLWGLVIARIGAKATYALGIIGTSLFSSLFAALGAVRDPDVFLGVSILLRVLMGVFCGAYLVAETSILISIFPSRIGSVLGLMETCGAIAVMVGPLIGGALYQLGGFHLPFLVLPFLIITIGIASLFIIPDAFHHERSKRSMCVMLTLPLFSSCMSFLVAFYAILSLHMALLALQLEIYQLTPIQVSLVFLTAPVLYMLFTPLSGLIVDKRPGWSYAQVIVGFALTGVFLTLLGPAPFYHIASPPLWLLIFSYGMVGIFGSALVAAISLMFRTVHECGWPDSLETYGSVAGFFQSSGSLGGAVGAILGGLVHETLGWAWMVTGAGFIVWFLVLLMILATVHHKYFKTASCYTQNKEESIPLTEETPS